MEGKGPGDGIIASGTAEVGREARAGTIGVVSLVQRTLEIFLARWYLFAVLAVPSTLLGLSFWHFLTVPTTREYEGLGNLLIFSVIMLVLYPATVLCSLAICAAADDLHSGRRTNIGSTVARGGRSRVVVGFFFLTGLLVAFVILVNLVILPLASELGQSSLPGVARDAIFWVVAAMFALLWWYVWWQGAALFSIGGLAGPDQSRRPRGVGDRRSVAAFLLFALLSIPSLIGAVWMSNGSTAVAMLVGAFIVCVAVTPLIPMALTIARRGVAGGAVSGSTRRAVAYLVFVLIASALVLAPSTPSIAATATDVFATVPPEERGILFAGAKANPIDACRPLNRRQDFSVGRSLFFGGYYRRPLLPGETATLRTYGDGSLLETERISTTDQRADCYAVELYVQSPGKFRYTVTAGSEALAEGEFTVVSR